jgi:glycerophosphoryl diester phosphodiesterase
MKKILFCGIGICILLMFMGGLYWHYEYLIHQHIVRLQHSVRNSKESKLMNANVDMIKTLPTLSDEDNAWYTNYHFIAHGGGGIDGKTYSNSLEAMELSYDNGLRVFDMDLLFTSDSVLVCCHSWEESLELGDVPMKESHSFVDRNGHVQHHLDHAQPLDYNTFKSRKVYRCFTPTSCEDMISFMETHPDVYIATDMKDDVEKSYSFMVNKAKEMGCENVLDRIIANVYEYDVYDKIMKIYQFKNTTARQHHVHPNNYYELAKFCVNNDIHVVNLSSCYLEDEGAKLLMSKGIHVFVAIVDYISDLENLKGKGFSGACTNWLKESDWNRIVDNGE